MKKINVLKESFKEAIREIKENATSKRTWIITISVCLLIQLISSVFHVDSDTVLLVLVGSFTIIVAIVFLIIVIPYLIKQRKGEKM